MCSSTFLTSGWLKRFHYHLIWITSLSELQKLFSLFARILPSIRKTSNWNELLMKNRPEWTLVEQELEWTSVLHQNTIQTWTTQYELWFTRVASPFSSSNIMWRIKTLRECLKMFESEQCLSSNNGNNYENPLIKLYNNGG